VTYHFSLAAYQGKVAINPQTRTTTLKGDGIIVWGRQNNSSQTTREVRCTLTPQNADFSADGYSSITLRATILEEGPTTSPTGRLLQFLGDVPADA
jgi:hypothetical protein